MGGGPRGAGVGGKTKAGPEQTPVPRRGVQNRIQWGSGTRGTNASRGRPPNSAKQGRLSIDHQAARLRAVTFAKHPAGRQSWDPRRRALSRHRFCGRSRDAMRGRFGSVLFGRRLVRFWLAHAFRRLSRAGCPLFREADKAPEYTFLFGQPDRHSLARCHNQAKIRSLERMRAGRGCGQSTEKSESRRRERRRVSSRIGSLPMVRTQMDAATLPSTTAST